MRFGSGQVVAGLRSDASHLAAAVIIVRTTMPASEQRIDFFSKYLSGLENSEHAVEETEPTVQLVRVLDMTEQRSIEELHTATGIDYTQLVPALKSLDSLGLADISGDLVSLTAQGELIKQGKIS
jgi:hypothetical protein